MGLFGGGGKPDPVIIAYRYSLGMHNVLTLGPVDAIEELRFEEFIAWQGSATTSGTDIDVDNEDLFGGDKREGGVKGVVTLYKGEMTQMPDSYLEEKIGTPLPAFRNRTSLVLKSFYFGVNGYLKPLSVILRRQHVQVDYAPQWYDGKAAIGADLNPAHIIRECITSPVFGLGQAGEIDETSFQAAADTLYDESFGLSFAYDKTESDVGGFINDIKSIIDGSVYQDVNTGKWFIKLIRDDYDPETLDEFDEDDISTIKNFSRPTVADLINDVTVKFTSRADNYKKRSAGAANIANINSQGKRIQRTFEYYGINTAALASTVATRELKQTSSGLFKAQVVGTRAMIGLQPGDVFKLSYPAYGISSVIVRVVDVDYGKLDANQIMFSVAEDVFGVGDSIYGAPQDTGWVSPVADPIDNAEVVVIDMPYIEAIRALGETTAANLEEGIAYGMTLVPQTQGQALGFEDWRDYGTGSGYIRSGSFNFINSATITGAQVSEIANLVVTLSELTALENEISIGDIAYYDGELMQVISIDVDTGGATFARGVLDTVPIAHAAGELVMFLNGGSPVSAQGTAGTSYTEKVLTWTNKSTLALGSATAYPITLSERFQLPYPPANPVATGSTGDLTITWKNRNRLDGYEVAAQDDATATPEVGQTTTVTILKLGTPVRTAAGLTGTSYIYTEEDAWVDFGLSVSGTLSPDWSGDYAHQGTHDTKDYFKEPASAQYIWWDTGTALWYLSDSLGVVPTDGWSKSGADPDGSYAPMGSNTGTATIIISRTGLTFNFKSARSTYESLTEWEGISL